MDNKLEVLLPPLKRAVNLLTCSKKSPQETHHQFLERVKAALIVGGIGARTSFNLSWDRIMIILVIKGLSNSDRCEILCRFGTFNISMDILNKFLLTLISVASNNSSVIMDCPETDETHLIKLLECSETDETQMV